MSNRLTVETHDCLNPVSAQEWNYLFHHSPNTAEMIQLQELVGLNGFTFHSILVKQNGLPVLLLPLYATNHDLTTTMNGPMLSLAKFMDFLLPNIFRPKLLRIGVVDQQCGQIGFDPHLDRGDLSLIWDLALRALELLAARLKVQILAFTEFTPETGHMLPLNKLADYCITDGAPFCQMPIAFDSVESYLNSMPKDMRHFLRRSKKKSQAVDVIHTRDPKQWIDAIYALYMGQVERSEINCNGTQSKAYFEKICSVDPSTHYVLFFAGSELIGFELLAQHQDTIISKFIGLDATRGRENNLYFRSWLELIEYCLDHHIKLIDLGCTHEALKTQLGATQLVPSFVLGKHRNPLLNLLLHQFKSHLSYYSEVEVPRAYLGAGWTGEAQPSNRPTTFIRQRT